jgi:hypothetical protein
MVANELLQGLLKNNLGLKVNGTAGAESTCGYFFLLCEARLPRALFYMFARNLNLWY